MAYAFDKVASNLSHVHRTDLLKAFRTNEFQALVACVVSLMEMFLGCSDANAYFIMPIKEQFVRFFADSNTIALGCMVAKCFPVKVHYSRS